ncbi:MAG: tetratricopeptide repeat protein [Phycisphaerales bacterium]|nr:MAG: tetratricopeptide repeat protein [Phycisphaerales bacterium]
MAIISVSALPAAGKGAPVPSVEQELARLSGYYEQGYFEWTAEEYRRLAERRDATEAALDIALGLSRCFEQIGRYEDEIAELEGVGAAGSDSPDWREAMARALSNVGRYLEAIIHAEAGLAQDPGHMGCRVRLGQLYELTGRKQEAIETYAWFEELLRRALPPTADELVLAGRGLYRYSVLSQHPHLKDRTVYVLQELFQYAYERLDRRNWRARLAAGFLLLSKYNIPEAVEEYGAALRLNPYLSDAHVGLGRAALEQWDFEKAEKHVRAALRRNPRLAEAHLLLAELRMTERKYRQAADVCRRALRLNPKEPALLSTLAAAQTRLGQTDAARRTRERVEQVNPQCPLLEYTLGRWLAASRQFSDAEKHLLRAIELAPEWVEPRTELGLMYMETGQERAAWDTLNVSWELDTFNRRTYNTLDLLETLQQFEQTQSENFVVKVKGSPDVAIAPYLIRYLESVCEEVCLDYDAELRKKTIVEVFPTHAQFAVRITGRPWIHTIGACTGRVIAMDAPRPSSGFGQNFNWAKVLRHEFVHTVTLAATRNRIPHWLTEGLAVSQEDMPQSWAWMQLLAGALREDRLFTPETIDWGFVRPERPTDRQLAYAQSEWMVEYIVSRWGYNAILDMLAAFREGLTQSEVFNRVLGTRDRDFWLDFRGWGREQAQGWGLNVDPLPSAFWLKAASLLRPRDAASRAQLADLSLLRGEVEEARTWAMRALELDPANTGALEVLCRLVLAAVEGEADKSRRLALSLHAAGWVNRLLDAEPHSWVALRLRADSLWDQDREEEASEWYQRLKMNCSADPISYRRLAALALERGDEREALGNLIDLWSHDAEDADVAMQAATLVTSRGRDQEALTWLERAAHVDPYRPEVHERLGALYSRFERWEDAAVAYTVLSRLEPRSAEHPARLALCYARLGRTTDAQAAARQAVKLDPDSPARSFLPD